MRFYLGTHMPSWLERVDFPLFISHRRLRNRRTLPVARAPWALDSGGFSEIHMHGRWLTKPSEYVAAVRRYRDEIGLLDWAAPQDWMCEPSQLCRSGLTVAEHQIRTVDNYLELHEIAPDLPFVPVLQGWRIRDYLDCADTYQAAGVDLTAAPLVGVGSMCRRQNTGEIAALVATLADRGLQLHGFGVKTLGLGLYAADLTSADSMAWSSRGRHVDGCTPSHKTEANCLNFARDWRTNLLDGIRWQQPALMGAA